MTRQVIATIDEHIHELANNMRQADRDEIWAAAHLDPLTALRHSVETSREPMTGLGDGRVVCIFGVSSRSPYSYVGHPWLLSTPEIVRHAVPLLRNSRRYIGWAQENFHSLWNYVDVRNIEAVKWISWLGFKLEAPAPFGMEGLPFHKFTWNRNHVL